MYDRSKSVGASDAVHIQKGDWAELYDRKQPSDATDYGLAAELGHVLEPFNLELFTRETGYHVVVEKFWQEHPMYLGNRETDDALADLFSWCTYLPDGLTINENDKLIPVEAKCINMMWKHEHLLNKYMPQLQHAMRVMGAPYCYFSVLYLNTKFEVTKIEYDPPYDDALFEKEKLFYWFLEQGQRPPQYLGKRKGWV